jgi:hypothetical protein
MLDKMMWTCELDSTGSRHGPLAGSFEHGNDPSGSIEEGIS